MKSFLAKQNARKRGSFLRGHVTQRHKDAMRLGPMLCSLIFLLIVHDLRAEAGRYLNYAILTIPAKFVADLPLNDRPVLLREVSERAQDDRLDYKGSFLDWHSDESEVHSTAPFCMKVFFFEGGDRNPVVFIHIQRWFSGGRQTWREAFVLQEKFGEWKDITREMLPKGIDRASYFKMSADSPDIEVTPYIERKHGMLYPYGTCKLALRWDGQGFNKVSTKLHSVAPEY